MPARVSVVIAAANEEERIGATVRSAIAAGASEVILCDGASTDRTVEIANREGARVLTTVRMRATQLNAGAAVATGDALIFLHGDTTLPAGAAQAVSDALEHAIFGGFRLRFAEPSPRLRVAETMINLRTAITRCPWGDQAQFLLRDTFQRVGGYKPFPLMEDYEMAVRMKGLGAIAILPMQAETSGRRFLQHGIWRTTLTNWRIVIGYHLGESPEDLAKAYRLT